MKRLVTLLLASAFTVSLLAVPSQTLAISLYQPFGGRVLTIVIPGITCYRGEGPIMIQPVGISHPGPFVIQLGQTKRYLYYFVRPGSWILGLYDPTPSPTSCVTDSVPPIPVPVFPIVMFGSSL